MTRKRRIQEDQNQNQGFHKRERFQRNERQQWNNGDGRQNDRNSGKGDGNNRGNYGRDDRNYGNNSGSDRNYERNDRNYGNDRNNDGNYGNNDGNYGDSGNYQSEARKEGKTEFPTALVRYLEQMARENPEEDMSKCFDIVLLKFRCYTEEKKLKNSERKFIFFCSVFGCFSNM